ncbi:hypothetical protein ACFX19_001255 [Malus domestica]
MRRIIEHPGPTSAPTILRRDRVAASPADAESIRLGPAPLEQKNVAQRINHICGWEIEDSGFFVLFYIFFPQSLRRLKLN